MSAGSEADDGQAADDAREDTTPTEARAAKAARRRNPLGDSIARQNALAPRPGRAGVREVGDPTSLRTAPADPRSGNASPGVPGLQAQRQIGSRTPNSSTSPALAGRPAGSDRAQTPPPGPGVAESATKALRDIVTGQYTAAVPGGVVSLDLATTAGGDAARHFRRPNIEGLPGRAALSPATQPANTKPEVP